MTNIPEDLEQIINDILAYEEQMKEHSEEPNSEYAYDYSEYPEYDDPKKDPTKNTIIKIDL